MEQYLLPLIIVVAFAQITTFVVILNLLKNLVTKNQTINEANYDTLKNLMAENLSATVSNLDSLKNLVTKNQTTTINHLSTINNKSEDILKELKEPLSLD